MGVDENAGGTRVAMSDNGEVRYFVTDHLGSTTRMINTDGSEFSDMEYRSWGSDRLTPPDIGTSFKYTGQREAEAGLYFYNARWYDPELGRFIQADSIIPEPGNPLAWDRYAYANNNPLYYTDPSGHWVDSGCKLEGCNLTQREADQEAQKLSTLEKQAERLSCRNGNTNNCSGVDKARDNLPRIAFGVNYGWYGQVGDAAEVGRYQDRALLVDSQEGYIYQTDTIGYYGYLGTPTGASIGGSVGITIAFDLPKGITHENIAEELGGLSKNYSASGSLDGWGKLGLALNASTPIDNRGQGKSISINGQVGLNGVANLFDGGLSFGLSEIHTNLIDQITWWYR